MAQVEEVPGAISPGRSREEARENVVDALRLMPEPGPDEPTNPDREPLDCRLRREAPRVGFNAPLLAMILRRRRHRTTGRDENDRAELISYATGAGVSSMASSERCSCSTS